MVTLYLALPLVFSLLTHVRPSLGLHENQPVIVHTTYGDILGYQTERARIFQGIPFAKPPINELR